MILFYMIEVYMDDYIALEMGRSRAKLLHEEMGVMTGIHYVFPPDAKDEDYLISLMKILKRKGHGPWSKMYLALTLMETLGNTLSG